MKAFTTGEVAEFVGTDEWRIRRLFEDGTLPEPDRFGGKRAISPELVPTIIDRLRARGWLSEERGLPMLNGKLLLTPSEAAEALSVSEKTLWSHTEPRGSIRATRLGRCVRYSVTELERWIASREQEAQTS